MQTRRIHVVLLTCLLLAPLCRAQNQPEKPKPNARFHNWLYQTADPTVWKQRDEDSRLGYKRVFSVDLPPGDFCRLTLYEGQPDLGGTSFEDKFKFMVDADLFEIERELYRVEADSGPTRSKASEGYDVLTRTLRCEMKTRHTWDLFVAGHSGGRFDFACFQTTSEETWTKYGPAASQFLLSLKLANSMDPAEVERLVGKAGAHPPAPAGPGNAPEPPVAPANPNGDGGEPGAKVNVVRSEVTARGPQGLFFMTRYWSGGGLEKAAWYFSPDGQVYQNLEAGISAQDLAAHKGPRGRYQLVGNELAITWPDGRVAKTRLELDRTNKNVFQWDMGIFTPVIPIEDPRSIVGAYEGGETVSHGGSAVFLGRTMEFKADGTYTMESAASVTGDTDRTHMGAGSQGATAGTWKYADYSITMTGTGGAAGRRIAFLVDVGEAAKRLYCGGMLYKRR